MVIRLLVKGTLANLILRLLVFVKMDGHLKGKEGKKGLKWFKIQNSVVHDHKSPRVGPNSKMDLRYVV
ncbi:hypothetical protein ES288_A10G177600v1 [Gossypium darwinii]|uniref:Uncharacterized protein n=1 Tax=Gossypium darwinii TaxID=34276 RepID=A0A5D2F0H6_GOSDA|nr:hypothetical protein ES288_A10G177600v1 [Gossypium darwinii]